ncbi:hypothetical protein BTA51_00800 [Hahella sp. CCB-MM4]|uniref:hypothetical protein n=1 Tax=Hahella sp. (strain CCB-MM4) TaxID=1926491 RepID=UPI000B9C136D|nr:hypothetical protein [Hahella sp. CCB-MM4]OZG74973.1 hypothetical protein BTA51_00800 [Hahella sp. CCB-MM4]
MPSIQEANALGKIPLQPAFRILEHTLITVALYRYAGSPDDEYAVNECCIALPVTSRGSSVISQWSAWLNPWHQKGINFLHIAQWLQSGEEHSSEQDLLCQHLGLKDSKDHNVRIVSSRGTLFSQIQHQNHTLFTVTGNLGPALPSRALNYTRSWASPTELRSAQVKTTGWCRLHPRPLMTMTYGDLQGIPSSTHQLMNRLTLDEQEALFAWAAERQSLSFVSQ